MTLETELYLLRLVDEALADITDEDQLWDEEDRLLVQLEESFGDELESLAFGSGNKQLQRKIQKLISERAAALAVE